MHTTFAPKAAGLDCGSEKTVSFRSGSVDDEALAKTHWETGQGQPTGELHYADGRFYIGQLKWGVPHGLGRMVYPVEIGEIYEGQFWYGKKKGTGMLVPPLWSEKYGGMPVYATFGDGGDNWEGIFDGQGYVRYVDGTTYEGSFKMGRWEGIGMLVNPLADIFAGMFEDNQFNGQGVMEYHYGARYEGNWKKGLMDGYGTLFFANGNAYQGVIDARMHARTCTYIQ